MRANLAGDAARAAHRTVNRFSRNQWRMRALVAGLNSVLEGVRAKVLRRVGHRAGFGSIHVKDPAVRARLLARANPELLLPEFFLIGAQKAATTFLHRRLADHPEVYMPQEEIRLFEDPLYRTEGIESFRLAFPPAAKARKRGIKRPDLLARPECPARIAKYVPDARLIVVLRHPLERAVAAYFHYMRLGFLPLRPLSEGMRELVANRIDPAHPRGADVVSYSLYGEHLARWLELFPRDRLLVLLQDELQRRPYETLACLARFLDIDPSFRPGGLRNQEMPTVYSLPRLRFIRALNRLKLEYSDDGTFVYNRRSPIGKAVWAGGMIADRFLLARVLSSRDRSLDPDLRDALMARFRPDIARLEALIGRDLAAWKEAPPMPA